MKATQQIDPTANVLKLVEEAVKREDDLRAQQMYYEKEFRGYEKEIRELEVKYREAKESAQALQNKTFENRIAEVERVQYEGKGKSEVTEPIMDKFLLKLDSLIESRSAHLGESKGKTDLWGWIIGGIMAVIALITYLTK